MYTAFKYCASLLALPFIPILAFAQQFIGSNTALHPSLSPFAYNPAQVAQASQGTMIGFASLNLLGSGNAYSLDKDFLFGGYPGGAQEGKEYFTNEPGTKKKYLYGNLEINGPSAAFRLKDNVYAGVYTRVREVINGGNVPADAFEYLGDQHNVSPYGNAVNFDDAGFSIHTFGEIGFSIGKVIRDDDFNIVRIGGTIKYLKGMNAATIYSPKAKLVQSRYRHIDTLKAEVAILYSENSSGVRDNDFSNDPNQLFTTSGKSSVGLDLGIEYEFRPTGTPNAITPYLYKLSAALTDVGAIGYKADTGSAVYNINILNKDWYNYDKQPHETVEGYLSRMVQDSVFRIKEKAETFRVGLPTALRLSFDLNVGEGFYVSLNTVLNLRGNNGQIYKAAYSNVFNFTPRYETRNFMIALPFTLMGAQTYNMGLALRAGPLFLGSSSIVSSFLQSRISSMDVYAGISMLLPRPPRSY